MRFSLRRRNFFDPVTLISVKLNDPAQCRDGRAININYNLRPSFVISSNAHRDTKIIMDETRGESTIASRDYSSRLSPLVQWAAS